MISERGARDRSRLGHTDQEGWQLLYFEKGYGVREFGKPAKLDPSTNFRLASDHKAVHRHGDHASGT